MSIRPLSNRVVIRPPEPETVTKGGIILPEGTQQEEQIGEVIATGNGKVMDNGIVWPMEVVIGDKVMFGSYAGQDIMVDGIKCKVMAETDIVAVIE